VFYKLSAALNDDVITAYGEYLLKNILTIDKFIITNSIEAEKIYGKDVLPSQQFDKLMKGESYNNDVVDKILSDMDKIFNTTYNTSTLAQKLGQIITSEPRLLKNINGITYISAHDNEASIVFNPSLLKPVVLLLVF
jgi:hypothetical protein